MGRSAKRITTSALVVWTAVVALLIAWHFAVGRMPWLDQQPFTHILALIALVGAGTVQSLMRSAPIRDVLPSRANNPVVNFVYAANLLVGLMAVWSGFYLMGFLGIEKPFLTALAVSILVASILVQGIVVAIPITGKQA
jgi:hypothetical protein